MKRPVEIEKRLHQNNNQQPKSRTKSNERSKTKFCKSQRRLSKSTG